MTSAACLALGLCLGQTLTTEPLDTRVSGATAWQGEGFYRTAASSSGPSARWALCSSDAGQPGRTGQMTRVLQVPQDAVWLHAQAYCRVSRGCTQDHRLDVVLVDEAQRLVPKRLATATGWMAATGLLPAADGRPRDYAWDLTPYRGRTLRLVARDLDARPGCHVYVSGARLQRLPVADVADFPQLMLGLERRHHLAPMARYDSKRFTAISNASEKFSRQHLRYCEVFHDLFVDHFRRRGFVPQVPKDRLAIAIFDSPRGFEAYLGRRMPSGITGVYHTPSNRLVLYDLSQNDFLLARREQGLRLLEGSNPHDRLRMTDTLERRYQDLARDANLGTTMHECAHLLSFNYGMLERGGDVPVWLAEGLACYCEATEQGDWQSLGAPNPLRIGDLRRARCDYLPFADLVRDEWLRSPRVLLGYAQSWALFRLLIQERPEALRRYLAAVRTRRAPEYRFADLLTALGHEAGSFERRYREYLDEVVARHPEVTQR